jgi:IS605 OrfB family transposase
MLENAYKYRAWFPYSVRLKVKNGNMYAFISIEEKLLPITIKKRQWDNKVAHKIIKIAKEENKVIAIENLNKLPKGKRGDGLLKLRRRLQKWSYKRLLSKMEILVKRNRIELIKTNPVYTSVSGKLKYASQYNIDKDITGAYVIARRRSGFKEKLPKNYKEFLNDTDFLSYTIARLEDNITKLKQKLKEEENEYKRDKLKTQINKLRKNLKTLQKHVSLLISHVSRLESGKSKPATQRPVNQRKKQVSGLPAGRHKSWQVLSIALVFCCLEKSYKDFSPLKRVIISKD